MISSPRWRSARSGADSEVFFAGSGVGWTSVIVAISAMAISAETP